MFDRRRMPHRRRRIVQLAAAAVLTLVAGACSSGGVGDGAGRGADGGSTSGTSQPEHDETRQIVIGQLIPLTGGLADMGVRMSRGAEIARQMVNEEQCLPGTEFVWNQVDAPDDEGARTGAERLLNDGVDVVFGTMGSSLSLAASSVVSRAGGVYWELGGGSATDLTERGLDGVYRVSSTATGLGVDAVGYIADVLAPQLGISAVDLTVAWAGVNNSYGLDAAAGVEQAAVEQGMTVVANLPYPGDSTDLSSVALQLRDADPDVLVLSNYTDDALVLARAMRAADVSPLAVVGTGAAHSDPSWIDGMGDDGNGYFTLGAVAEVNPDGLLPEAKARYEKYVDRYRAEFGTEPVGMDRMGFDGAWALMETICRAGSTDRDAIAAAASQWDLPMRSLLNGDGLHFSATGQNERVQWPVSQWQAGTLVPVAPDDLALAGPVQVPLPGWGERG